ncbi:MAG TPA: tetratricopeptide repeat protein [Kofleriaceae bacterium]|nr:tetratricopeptide repeat protein [Kofleriaceae bacterium]
MSIGAVTVIVLLIRATTVDAQPIPASFNAASASPQAEAAKLTDEAIAAQGAQDYDTAIELYKKAYQLVPHPVLLFDIAQTNWLASDLVEAELFYRRYLERDPDGPYAQMARERIASITQDASAAPQNPTARAAMLRYASYTLMGFGVLLGAGGIKTIYQERGYVSLTIGCTSVGLIGTGVVVYMYSKRQSQRRPAKSLVWSPVIGTGFAGFALTGTLP